MSGERVSVEARTFVLSVSAGVIVADEEECSFAGEEIVEVIELEPVLDLLERLVPRVWITSDVSPCAGPGFEHIRPAQREAIALLRTHGRLRNA